MSYSNTWSVIYRTTVLGSFLGLSDLYPTLEHLGSIFYSEMRSFPCSKIAAMSKTVEVTIFACPACFSPSSLFLERD